MNVRHHQSLTLPTLGALLLVMAATLIGLNEHRAIPVQAAPGDAPALSQVPYPRFFLYTGITGNGWPLVSVTAPPGVCAVSGAPCRYRSDCGGNSCSAAAPNPDSWDDPLVTQTVQQFAGFPLIVMPPSPAGDRRTEILSAIHAVNPATKIFAYTLPTHQGCALAYVQNDHSFNLSFWNTIKTIEPNANPSDACDYTGPGRLWLQNGQVASSAQPYDVNWAYRVVQPDNSATYPLAEAMAITFFQELYQPQLFDGIFLDQFCEKFDWIDAQLTSKIDYTRASYTSAQEFYNGWTAGQLVFANRLRALIDTAGGSDFPIVGNCGPGPTQLFPSLNGWMRERFPFLEGGTWYSNMYRYPAGYLFEDRNFRPTQLNTITAVLDSYWQPYGAEGQRKARFTLASASLGDGYGAITDGTTWPDLSPMHEWWYDEFAVNTTNASLPSYGAAAGAEFRGWLGMPKGDAYQVIAANANPELVTPNDFSTNTTGWQLNFGGTAAATMTRDTATGGSGGESIKVHITAVDTYDYAVQIASTNNLPIFNANEYSVTFWAKADRLRAINVVLDHPPGNTYANQHQPITTEWKRYQVRLKPTTSDASASFRFSLGQEVGDVWLDDIHVQQGITSVYRRDFDRGIVLVNPSNDSQTVTLERTYRKILGTVSPTVNDGSVVSSVTLAGASSNGFGDALFLIDFDQTAPAQVNNLTAQ